MMRRSSRRGVAEDAALRSKRCNRSYLDLLKDCGFETNLLAAIQHTDTWWVMSAKDDTSSRKVDNFYAYKSGYLLTKMIGCNGGDFGAAIFEDKSTKVSKVKYLEDTFGVKAELLRNEVIIFSFNKNAVYDRETVKDQFLKTEPFSLDRMNDLIENIRKSCTKELAHKFMLELKALDEEERARATLERLFSTSDRGKLMEIIASTKHDDVTHTEQCDSRTPVVDAYDSEVGLQLQDSCEESTLCVDTRFGSQHSSAAIVSPLPAQEEDITLPAQDEDVAQGATASPLPAIAQEEDITPAQQREKNTIKAIKTLCRRRGQRTIDHLENDPKSDLTEWSEDKDMSRPPYEDARTVKAILHAVSGQNCQRAAETIDLVLKKDSDLASAVEITQKVDTDSDIDRKIVSSQVDFLEVMNYNKGTRHTLDQEAVDVVHTASLFSAEKEDHNKIKSRMQLSARAMKRVTPQIDKLHSKLKSQSSNQDGKKSKQVWEPIERKLREDQKRDKAAPYVEAWCHDEGWDRVSRIDTGENIIVRVKKPDGEIQKHPLRRYNDDIQTKKQLYEMWQNSAMADKLKKEEGIEICDTIFRQLVCPCCKFGKNEMCADLFMSGAEEARSAMQSMVNRDTFEAEMFNCKCEFHTKDGGDYAKNFIKVFLKRVEEIIDKTLCPRKEYPELKKKACPGFESTDEERVPKLHDFACIFGDCKSECCGVDNYFGDMMKCPLFQDTCLPCSENNTQSGDIVEVSDATISNDGSENIRQEDSSHEPCSWNQGQYKCCVLDLPLEKCAQANCHSKTHRCCQTMAEEIMYKRTYPQNDYPPTYPETNSFEYDKMVCLDCHPVARTTCPIISDGTKYKVKVWAKKEIPKTNGKKQNELVEQCMTSTDLFAHFLDCIKKAREHYVKYRYVDWSFDCWVHNTLQEHNRIIVKTDFSASADLHARRVACGSVDTHAVICVMHVHSYEPDRNGGIRLVKRSFIFIGPSDGAGKKNDWKFHIACAKHVINWYKERLGKLVNVIFMTDNCPGQYKNRFNALLVAMLSSEDNYPTLQHLFACVYRFKGPHDSDGGEIKRKIRESVRRGDEGTTAFHFFESSKERSSFKKDVDDVKKNHLSERIVNYVVYSKEEYNELNSGKHAGHIVFADMDYPIDTDRIPDTNTIFEMIGVSRADAEKLEQRIDLRPVWNALQQIERDKFEDGTNESDNETFMEQYDCNRCTAKERARYDFLHIARNKLSKERANEIVHRSLNDLLPGQPKASYETEFLMRAGKFKGLKQKSARESALDKWMECSSIERLYKHRSKEQIAALHKHYFPQERGRPSTGTIAKLIGDVIGFDHTASCEDPDEEFFLQRSNLPCTCTNCMDGNSMNCESPFLKYMQRKIVRMRKKTKDSERIEDDD